MRTRRSRGVAEAKANPELQIFWTKKERKFGRKQKAEQNHLSRPNTPNHTLITIQIKLQDLAEQRSQTSQQTSKYTGS